MAVGGDSWEGRGDGDDFVAEAGELIGVGLHGKGGVHGEVALAGAELGPIFGGERFSEIVGGEEDAFAADGESEHIDVLGDGAGERIEVGDTFAAGEFFEFGVEIEGLVLVAREEDAGGEAAAVFELEEIAAVESDWGTLVLEIGGREDGIGDVVGGVFVIGALDGGFAENLRVLLEGEKLGVDGGDDGFAGFGSGVRSEGASLLFLLAGFEKLEAGGLEFLEFLAAGFFFANVEIAPVDDAGGIAGGFDLRAEIADPGAVVRSDFDADAIGFKEIADLKFLAALGDGGLGGVIGSEEKDGAEIGGGADDSHLDFAEVLLDGEVVVDGVEEAFGDLPRVVELRVEGLEGEHDDVGGGVLRLGGGGLGG